MLNEKSMCYRRRAPHQIECGADSAVLSPLETALFWSKVNVGYQFECWPWTGTKSERGYGVVKNVRAHRIAYRLINGTLDKSDVVRHSCDNPPCCNPKHLLRGTQQDNSQDCLDRGRTARGERSGKWRLTNEQALEIKAYSSSLSARELSRRYGVSTTTISHIRNGKRRKYLA